MGRENGLNVIFTFLWLTNDEFKEKYQPLVKRILEDRHENWASFDYIQDLGGTVLQTWVSTDELYEQFPELLNDLADMLDVDNEKVLQMINSNLTQSSNIG